ncbi:hypothetical protein [Anabaena azotica]|uniref:Uncharacterized protein n=1 Tax=Anabaena azotica FACHB-119 TaxID=947527 RepID=A0ABR8DCE3_9NOST|nr:hypothetical protein [Anabaena azotica]MBD2504597.1 hypothetical protein [Anabaena azotica FACHB-119]
MSREQVIKSIFPRRPPLSRKHRQTNGQAIAERSKVRPRRMDTLKLAGLFKGNPGLDFLMVCWQDDPALQIVITRFSAEVSAVGLCGCGWAVDGVGERVKQ